MTTLILQPNAAAGQDTLVGPGAGATFNYGIYTRLMVSATQKGLIKFDLSSIPSSSLCSYALLSLYQSNTGAATAFILTAYSIAVGNAAWVEGTKNAALAGAGEPCWNALAADGLGGVTTPWAGGAGLPTAGVDYVAASIGSTSGNSSDPNGTEYQFNLTPNVVRTWFGPTNQNYGILIVSSAFPGGLASSDYATPGWRPKLTVEYHRRYAPLRRIR